MTKTNLFFQLTNQSFPENVPLMHILNAELFVLFFFQFRPTLKTIWVAWVVECRFQKHELTFFLLAHSIFKKYSSM